MPLRLRFIFGYPDNLETSTMAKLFGRHKDRARGVLQYLEAGESKEYHLEIGILTSAERCKGAAGLRHKYAPKGAPSLY
jgi:hypothetical protein